MPRKFTANELIKAVRDKGGFNDAESEGTQDSDILNRLNEECWTTLYNVVLQAHREFFVLTELVPLTGGPRYRINPRAMYQKLRDLYFNDGSARYGIPMIDRTYLEDYGSGSGATRPSGFYVENNWLVLIPDSGASGYAGNLEVSFYFRPGELVLLDECRLITGVDATNKQIMVDSAPPTSWATLGPLDAHSGSSGAEIHAFNLTPTSIVNNVITVSQAIDGSLTASYPIVAGDYICLAETAALPGLPRELHPILVDATIASLLRVKDPEAYQATKEDLEKQVLRMMNVVSERVDSRAPVIHPNWALFGMGGQGS